MSKQAKDMALRHLKKGESQLNSGLYIDALESLTIAENHAQKGAGCLIWVEGDI